MREFRQLLYPQRKQHSHLYPPQQPQPPLPPPQYAQRPQQQPQPWTPQSMMQQTQTMQQFSLPTPAAANAAAAFDALQLPPAVQDMGIEDNLERIISGDVDRVLAAMMQQQVGGSSRTRTVW